LSDQGARLVSCCGVGAGPLQAGRQDRRRCEVLFLKFAADPDSINPDPSGPGVTGIEKMLDSAGRFGLICAGVRSLAVAGGAAMFVSPDGAGLLDGAEELACGLQLDACGRVGHAPAPRGICRKQVFSLALEVWVSRTVSSLNAASDSLREICRWECCCCRAAA
jgi:hypothetical protein